MEYIQEITLDLNTHSAPLIVNAKQNDTDTRKLLVHYTKNGEEYKINTNNSVALRVRKPDMHLIFNNGVVNNNGTVSVTLTQQCLAVAGRAYADLVEFNSSGQMLSTVSFVIDIQAMPDVMGNEAISSNEFLYLKSFIDTGNGIIGKAQEWANGYNGETPISSSNPAYHNNAKYYAEQANMVISEASQAAEAWAVGTKNGVPVENTNPAYHNNAEYYAEQSGNNFIKTQNIMNSLDFNFEPSTGELTVSYDT